MSTKQPEIQVRTSMKNLAWFIKAMVVALGAAGAGAIGGVMGHDEPASVAQEERIVALERNCQKIDVRIATAEAEVDGLKASYLDIKKDLAEIRSTNTQILFILRDR